MKQELVGILIGIAIIFGIASAGNAESKRTDPAWTIQIGYSPVFANAYWSDEDGTVSNFFGPVHGGSMSFDWRSKGHWGVQVPIGINSTKKDTFINVGVNTLAHFLNSDTKVDPYAILGASWFFSPNKDDLNLPFMGLANLGLGIRGYFSKNVGMYAEGIIHPLIIINVFETKIGLSIRF